MIEDKVRDGLLGAFPAGFQLILANQNGPRPDGMYGTVRIESARSSPAIAGRSEAIQPAPTFAARELASHHNGTVEVQVFGTGAFDTLSAAVLMLDSLAAIESADAAGVVFGTTQNIVNEPALRNAAEYEERALASIPFAYTRRVIESVPVIETVEGSASVSGAPPATFRSHHGEN